MTTPGPVVVVDEGLRPSLACVATGGFPEFEERTSTTAPNRAMRTTPATPTPTRTPTDVLCRCNHRMTDAQEPNAVRVDCGPPRKWWRARAENSDSDSGGTGERSTIRCHSRFRRIHAERARKIQEAMCLPTSGEVPFNPLQRRGLNEAA
jgi:hypothetical protein